MKKIRSQKELQSEKLRLKLKLNATKEILKEDFEWIQNEITSGKIAGSLISNIFGKNVNGLLNNGFRIATDVLLNNILLSKSTWVMRLIIPFIVKSLSSAYLSENKSEIFGIMRTFIQKARKSIKQDDVKFDKSTVDGEKF